jgi:hypothetical protein
LRSGCAITRTAIEIATLINPVLVTPVLVTPVLVAPILVAPILRRLDGHLRGGTAIAFAAIEIAILLAVRRGLDGHLRRGSAIATIFRLRGLRCRAVIAAAHLARRPHLLRLPPAMAFAAMAAIAAIVGRIAPGWAGQQGKGSDGNQIFAHGQSPWNMYQL